MTPELAVTRASCLGNDRDFDSRDVCCDFLLLGETGRQYPRPPPALPKVTHLPDGWPACGAPAASREQSSPGARLRD